ncbi:unnamed protein product, partial [Coccothraustes coccothraustes]
EPQVPDLAAEISRPGCRDLSAPSIPTVLPPSRLHCTVGKALLCCLWADLEHLLLRRQRSSSGSPGQG